LPIARAADAAAAGLGYVACVNRPLPLPRLPLRGRAADAALAGLLAVLAQVEVWVTADGEGPRPLVAVAAVLMTLPLAWRRRAPIVVATVFVATLTVSSLAWDTPDTTLFPTAALVLATYSVAAHSDLRGALAGGAIVLLPAFVLEGVIDGNPGNFFFIAVLEVSVWTAGRAVRSHGSRAARIAESAVVLERESEERARTAVAEERTRIARELHDIVAHSVTTMVVQAGAERRVLDDGQASTREALLSIEKTGREALAEMRRLLGMLRKDDEELALAPRPSMAHVDVLVDQVRAAGLPVKLRIEGRPVPLPPGVDLSAYRIVQEALTNALKHAGPAEATVTVRYGTHELRLEIADSGRGATDGHGGGHGLIGMRERVALYGGDLDAGSRAGHGYTVQARLPLGPPTA
jgi:signal transduction histidine kinase